MLKNRKNLENMVILALLTAMQIMLSRFFSFNALHMKIGFSFIPVFIAARRNGMAGAAFVSGMGDFIGAHLFPFGPYYFPFTFTAILFGVIDGFFMKKSTSAWSIVLAVLLSQAVCSMFLNSLWMTIFFGKGFMAILPERIFQAVVMGVVQIAVGIPLLNHASIRRMLKGNAASAR